MQIHIKMICIPHNLRMEDMPRVLKFHAEKLLPTLSFSGKLTTNKASAYTFGIEKP